MSLPDVLAGIKPIAFFRDNDDRCYMVMEIGEQTAERGASLIKEEETLGGLLDVIDNAINMQFVTRELGRL